LGPPTFRPAARSALGACDISDAARPIAIDGTRALIDRGEAMFWIAATYARCMAIFHNDDPAALARFNAGFVALRRDLGIASFDGLRRVEALTADVWTAAERMIEASTQIRP